MPRPWVLVFLLLVFIFTLQFEWKQQFGNEIESTVTISRKEQSISKQAEAIKEKIILLQEKNIQKRKLASLREQLLQCKSENDGANATSIPLSETENLHELELQQILED